MVQDRLMVAMER